MADHNEKSGFGQPGAESPDSHSTKLGVSTAVSPQAVESVVRRRAIPTDAAFEQSEDPRYYKPIDSYEGLHRWDPEFEWEEEEEKRLVRKVCSLPFFFLFVVWFLTPPD
jgi:hypothetical protein